MEGLQEEKVTQGDGRAAQRHHRQAAGGSETGQEGKGELGQDHEKGRQDPEVEGYECLAVICMYVGARPLWAVCMHEWVRTGGSM